MDIWEELKKNLSSAVDAASRGAGRLTSEARLRINIAMTEKRIDDAAAKLGKLRYDELKNGADNAGGVCETVAELDELYAGLESLKAQKTEAERNVRRCSACGAVLSDDAVFCSKCGVKQTDD